MCHSSKAVQAKLDKDHRQGCVGRPVHGAQPDFYRQVADECGGRMNTDTSLPISRRALLFAGAILPAAAIVAPPHHTPADPVVALAQQWLALDDEASAALSDIDLDKLSARQVEVGRFLMNTPSTTVAGLVGKLAVFCRFLGVDDQSAEFVDTSMLLSLLADAKALEQLGS